MSTIVTLEDKTNGLLKRREVTCLFKGYAGKLSRKEAVEMLAKELKLDKKFVIPISLKCETGMNDIRCTFYVYDDENLAKKHLPKYFFIRMLTEEERKAAKETAKAKAKPEGAPAKPKEAAKEQQKEEAKEKAEAKAEKPKKEVPAEAKTEDKPEKPKKEAKGKEKPEEEKK